MFYIQLALLKSSYDNKYLRNVFYSLIDSRKQKNEDAHEFSAIAFY